MKNAAAVSILILLSSFILGAQAFACAVPAKTTPTSPKKWKAYFKQHSKATVESVLRDPAAVNGPGPQSVLPSAKLNPWGGSDPRLWKPEAIVANAASEALNDAWADAGVKDVLVAIPLKLLSSRMYPYGDGQSNAAVTFGAGWVATQPPVVATLTQLTNGIVRIKFRIEPSLLKDTPSVRLVYHLGGAPTSKMWSNLTADDDGHFEITWAPSGKDRPTWGDLFQNHVAFIQVGSAKDWYPIDFRDVVMSANEMLDQVPEGLRKLGKGTLLDPELISSQLLDSVSGIAPVSFPFLGMESETFGKDINADRYFPVDGPGIHSQYPLDGGTGATGPLRVTAVGHGNTVVMIRPPSVFKSAYICFDARDVLAEAAAGVPSGGGWHKIGDPAETVMNTLETDSVLFGYANALPAAAPPSGGFAAGLSDVAVLRRLKPGSALISSEGSFHWFAFHQTHEVCALEWVHPAVPVPGNHFGFESLWK